MSSLGEEPIPVSSDDGVITEDDAEFAERRQREQLAVRGAAGSASSEEDIIAVADGIPAVASPAGDPRSYDKRPSTPPPEARGDRQACRTVAPEKCAGSARFDDMEGADRAGDHAVGDADALLYTRLPLAGTSHAAGERSRRSTPPEVREARRELQDNWCLEYAFRDTDECFLCSENDPIWTCLSCGQLSCDTHRSEPCCEGHAVAVGSE